MNQFNVKKIFFIIIPMLLFASMAVYVAPRYGWRLFGFKYCEDPSTLIFEQLAIDYNNGFIEIIGNTTISFTAYVGSTHKLSGTTLYVGMKYNSLTGFSNRNGRFEVHIPIETERIEKIILKGKQGEKIIWEKGEPQDPQE